MSDISKAELKKEIQAILKDADLDNTSAKKVRLELQEKLDCDLSDRKKEVDNLVMEIIDEQTQEDDDEEDEEEDEGEEEESEQEESEEEKPKPKKKAAAPPARKQRAPSESGSNYSEDADEAVDSDGGGSDYEPDEPVRIPKKRTPAKKNTKRKYGSDDESSGEEWGSAKKKKSGGKKKSRAADSDDDSDYEKPKKKKKRAGGSANGYTAPVKLSENLADIVGGNEMPRHEVVKRMWQYIKDNNLQDPKNKQMIKCDEKLSKVIPTKTFRGFGMTKFLKDHMNVD